MGTQSESTLMARIWAVLVALLLIPFALFAQERKVDPTWLHRYVPQLRDAPANLVSESCHYKAIFGEGDAESRVLQSFSRFAEATLSAGGKCQSILYDRQEEIYFVLQGQGVLEYGDQTYPLRANDFTYIPPGIKHSIANSSKESLRVLVIGVKIPQSVSITAPPPQTKIVNLSDVKEQTVQGHPSSVLYKLLAGPRQANVDAIDDGYVIKSFFWMDFAPGGTNFPHHHQTAEEIYLVLDGQGDMVAGGGMDGIEGRHAAKGGDAYYFRPNCTVGFYNQNKAGAKAHILAVRSPIPLAKGDD
jgi:mannose-6-phosphate isomerase-like protein (cupin superfamily)